MHSALHQNGGKEETDKSSLLSHTLQYNTNNRDTEHALKVEEDLFRHLQSRKALMAARELARGIEYNFCFDSGWRPPFKIRKMHTQEIDSVREKLHLQVEGEDIPPPIKKFKYLRLPYRILGKLKAKRIKEPFKIQIQGLPIGLSGRDLIGISHTGSGKTLTFVIPMIMNAYQVETIFPLHSGEGPLGFVLCPSRELAKQNYEQTVLFSSDFVHNKCTRLKCILSIGGVDSKTFMETKRNQGIYMMIATPGRLKDYLQQGKITFNHCRFVCLDEADRMVDLGFEDDMRFIWSFFKYQRQTLMFSATMPSKILQFAESALVDPITVKVSRAGAANANIVQQVEYVKVEHRLMFILECLTRTAPPVLIFAENKSEVNKIHGYLSAKKIKTTALHSGKSQLERNLSIKEFKSGEMDILVATDVIGKGLDFPLVKHVINYDMPKNIENYVHRIGRTGRGANKGLATTFINRDSCEVTLRDLKALLIEAGQRIPPILQSLYDKDITMETLSMTGQKGCIYCGGLGHRIVDCLKMKADKKNELQSSGGNIYKGINANM